MAAIYLWCRDWIRARWDWLRPLDYLYAWQVFGAPKGYSISGYAYKLELAGKPWGKVWRPFIDFFAFRFYGEKQRYHCLNAYTKELAAIAQGKPLYAE
jgi:hypothetical protein